MDNFCFSVINFSFMPLGFLYTDKYWLENVQKTYPRDYNIPKNWLKKVIPNSCYCFITADYQRARVEEFFKNFKMDQYIIYRSKYFGNNGHYSQGNHLQLIVMYFPKDYKYEE